MSLADRLVETWVRQGRDGFLLVAGKSAETKLLYDPVCGVQFRFRWLPHRDVRGDIAKLEHLGIVDPDRDEASLFRDPREPVGRHCFLCERNIRECNPKEELVPLRLAGRDWLAGANFAWIARDHFTVMTRTHMDQKYSPDVLSAAVHLVRLTGGRFRVLFNGGGAGATVLWHMHLQATSERMPVEGLDPRLTAHYPAPLLRFAITDQAIANRAAEAWLAQDPENHSLNLLVCSSGIFLVTRDRRKTKAKEKGLVGGFEVAGDFAFSMPFEKAIFDRATAGMARRILSEINP